MANRNPEMTGIRNAQDVSKIDTQIEQRLVLIGKTGNGKSACGNTILGDKLFESKPGAAKTKKCEYKRVDRFGKRLVIVDTPGLFDVEATLEKTAAEIMQCTIMASPGPHAFLITISVTRFTPEEKDTVYLLSLLFSDEMYNHSVVLFTRKDDLDVDGQTMEEFFSEMDLSLKTILGKCGNRYVFFNNRGSDKEKDLVVRNLLDIIDSMRTENATSYYTCEFLGIVEKHVQEKIKTFKERDSARNNTDVTMWKDLFNFIYAKVKGTWDYFRRQQHH